MVGMTSFRFTASTPNDAETFVTEYVVDAVDRVEGYDECEWASFAYANHPETGELTLVTLPVWGDPGRVVEEERATWESYVEEGLLDDWGRMNEMDAEEMAAMLGERTAALWPALASLASDVAGEAYETFESLDRKPAAVDTYPSEDSAAGPVGWWAVLHTATVQLNYDLDEELDAYLYGIEHTLRNFGEYEGEDAVDERIDAIEDELDRLREEAKEGRLYEM